MIVRLKPSNIARRLLAGPFVQQCRHRHQPPHRMINVQLLSDVDDLGKLGTIQSVSPGRMRSTLYPQGKAAYILKGVAPRLPPLVHQRDILPDEDNAVKFENLQTRIKKLPPIVFHKRLLSTRHSANPTSARNRQPIYGSVTLHDVAVRLKQIHNLSLTLPDALMSFDAEGYQDKIKSTGLATLFVKLRNKVTVPLKILVEPEVNVEKQAVQ